MMLMLAKEKPMVALGRLVSEHETRLWRTIHHYVHEARRADFSNVRCVRVDETATTRGQNYITLFVDLERSQLSVATDGRKAETVTEFRDDLEAHGGVVEQIEEFCMDMSMASIRGVQDSFPDAI